MTLQHEKRKTSLPGSEVQVKASVILLDIEGTTTSISFVKDELFPYVTSHLEDYLTKNYEVPATQDDIEALRQLCNQDKKDGVNEVPTISNGDNKQEVIHTVIANVLWQMSTDRKSTALKQLQGHMWHDAYKNGEVKGHLYPDVKSNLKRWDEQGKKICIYSSGSVEAQKLLFNYSVDGDLTTYLSQHFDTKVGGKKESDSYKKISGQLGIEPSEIVFLTDVIDEAKAAKEAGMSAIVMLRPGNASIPEEELANFDTMENFSQLIFEKCNGSDVSESKKQKTAEN